jgi:hypothetical protein
MLRRTEHAVYDLKCHLVWVPRYHKSLLVGAMGEASRRNPKDAPTRRSKQFTLSKATLQQSAGLPCYLLLMVFNLSAFLQTRHADPQ